MLVLVQLFENGSGLGVDTVLYYSVLLLFLFRLSGWFSLREAPGMTVGDIDYRVIPTRMGTGLTYVQDYITYTQAKTRVIKSQNS